MYLLGRGHIPFGWYISSLEVQRLKSGPVVSLSAIRDCKCMLTREIPAPAISSSPPSSLVLLGQGYGPLSFSQNPSLFSPLLLLCALTLTW